jgi:hypothetical protein
VLDLNAVKLDLEKVDGGCWWEVSTRKDEEGKTELVGKLVDKPDPEKTAVLLVPIGIGYLRQRDRERMQYAEELRSDDIDDVRKSELDSLIGGNVVAKKVLRGWQNLGFGDGPVPWSETEAIRVLTMREMRNLLDFCIDRASERGAALAREEATAQGN